MTVNGFLVALGGIVIHVAGIVILEVRVVLFGLVLLLGGSFAIYWFFKKSRTDAHQVRRTDLRGSTQDGYFT